MKYSMKYFYLIPIFILNNLLSQNSQGKFDDISKIALTTFLSDESNNLMPEAKNILLTKLNEITTKNGIGANSISNRFIITANVIELTKDISTTIPLIYSYNLQVTFFIGDGIEGTKFASHSVELKGAGNSEIKAYLSTLKNIKPTDEQYKKFIDEGKNKIIEYYNTKCDFILKEAKMFESKNEFESAISILLTVPEVCKDCFDKCMDAIGPIYQKHIDMICKKDFMEATTQWNLTQDHNAAINASKFLINIDPLSTCYEDAKKLNEKISTRLKEIDQREWDFQLKQQQAEIDLQNRSMNLKEQEQIENNAIRKASIQSARDIGLAYALNQPKTIVKYNIKGWW
jgi:hypothetical protein